MKDAIELDKRYSELLLDRDFLKLEIALNKPNIFTVLKIENREIKHSNFLAWLLNPNQTHGLRTLFLKFLLADIFHDKRAKGLTASDVAGLPLEKAIIRREWCNIDILIQIEDVAIVIENKIWAGETGTQLESYINLIEGNLKYKKKAYVFLSPFGVDASREDVYISYSYRRIMKILELVKDVYGYGIPNSVLVYIDDYLEIIRRNSMMTSESNKLARQIFSNHRELIEFIYKNKPDEIKELRQYIEGKIERYGWIKGSSYEDYIRFLTPALKDIIPNDGIAEGWYDHEAFLFEFVLDEQSLEFYYTISPGDEKTQLIIKEALENHEFKIVDSKFFCYSNICYDIDRSRMNVSDADLLDKYLETFWLKVKRAVDQAEKAILKVSKELSEIKNRTVK